MNILLSEQEIKDLIQACNSDIILDKTNDWIMNDVELDRHVAEEHARIRDLKVKLEGVLNEEIH